MPHKLILMDGSAFLFRAYFSTLKQNLTNQEGFPTGAMFGVINAIKHLQKQYPEAKIITIFDTKGKNFRHDIYPQYKAHRKPADSELVMQIEPLYEIIKAMGFHFMCVPEVEADDVIATLSCCVNQNNIKTIIASGDKDLMQLVGANISQLDMKGILYNRQGVIEKMGVAPEQILDLLALTGDSADNIPGVPSVGPKTAIKWLQIYSDIAGVKENAAQIKGKVGEKLRDNFDLLDLSHRLVELKFDVALPCNILDDDSGQDVAKLADLYQQYGFSMWLKQLGNVPMPKRASTQAIETAESSRHAVDVLEDYSQTLVLDLDVFNTMVNRLTTSKTFVFDLETTSLDYMNAAIVGWVFLV